MAETNANNDKKKIGIKAKINLTISTYRFFFKKIWQFKKRAFLVQIIAIIAEIINPFVIVVFPKLVIDELLGQQKLDKIILYVILTIGISQGLSLIISLANIKLEKYSDFLNRKLENLLSKKSMTMDFQYTENPEVLFQMQKAKEGISWYSGGPIRMMQIVSRVISNAITVIGSATLFILDFPLLIVIILITIIVSSIVNAKINSNEVKNHARLSGINRSFGYYLYNITDFNFAKDFRLYNSQKMIEDKVIDYTEKTSDIWKRNSVLNSRLTYISDIFGVFRDALSYLILGVEALMKRISIGDFTMYAGLVRTLSYSVFNCIFNIQEMYKRSLYANEYVKFINYSDIIEKGKLKVEDKSHTIEFRNVSFKYPSSNEYVLKNVSIKLNQGEHLSVVGLNGAGKTTFIKLLCRLYDVTEGEILLDNINIKEYNYDEYIGLISVVFQDFSLFAFTLGENIAFADYNESNKEKIEQIISIVGLKGTINKHEKRLDTYLFKNFEESGTYFSGGEIQKLAIARALYKDSPIVILDEPTAALDPMAEYEIYRQFNSLVHNKTAIYISHRLSSCKFCDKIAVFSENTIKEFGTHEQLISINGGVYNKMYLAQSKYYQ